MRATAGGAEGGSASALEVRGVGKSFGGTRVLRRIDLTIPPGEYLCLLGPSGSGKSTLLRMIAGFDAPDEGEILLGGRSLLGTPPEGRDVHTVFQGYALFPHLSVEENVGFALSLRKVPSLERESRVAAALALVGLPGYQRRRTPSLSGGEQQRIALARALVNRPSLLLLDEPLSALDRKLRLQMQEELKRIQGESRITFLHVTHDQEEALRLGDRIAVMNEGELLQTGSPAEVYRRPRRAFVADFLGSANLVEGGRLPGTVQGGLFAIRPEAIRVVRPGSPSPGGGGPGWEEGAPARANAPSIIAQAVLLSRSTLGAFELLRVDVGGLELTVHAPSGELSAIGGAGDPLTLSIDPESIVPVDR